MHTNTADRADELLHEFFRQEVPKPWPPLQLPGVFHEAKSQRRRALRRSHLALAASLAILVAGLALASELLRDSGSVPTALPSGPLPGAAKKPGGTIRHTPPATTPDKPVEPSPEAEPKPFSSPLSALPRWRL